MDYEQAVGLINDVEGAAVQQKAITIDVNALMSNAMPVSKYDYQRINSIINSIDSIKTAEAQAAPAAQAAVQHVAQAKVPSPAQGKNGTALQTPKPSELQKGAISAVKGVESVIGSVGKNLEKGIEQERQRISGKGLTLPQMPKIKPAATVAQQQPRGQQKPHKEVSNAAAEIKGIIGEVGRGLEERISRERQKISWEKLVMPTLSLQDQIAELEKISLGLEGNVFNKGQLSIIRNEMEGLSESVKHEKEPLDAFQKSLVELRNQRLREARAKLR